MAENVDQDLMSRLWEAAGVMRSAGLNVLDSIEHLIFFLYLKLLDDQECRREATDPTYRTRLGDDRWRFYHWVQQWPDLPRFISQQLFPYLAQLLDQPGVDNSDIREVFSNAYFLLQEPESLRRLLYIVQAIGPEEGGLEIIGAVFENLLGEMPREARDLGQFFTPRHLVDLMVSMVNPQIGETIYDPACGTGGFLVRCYQHLRGGLTPDSPDYKEKLLLLQTKTIYGRERNRRTHKLAMMNMVLHDDGHSNLVCGDSLSADAQEPNCYDVIFTDPPFGSAVLPQAHLIWSLVPTRDLESLFLQHIMRSLKPGGRAAMIVSEGMLFRGGAQQEIRRLLLRDFSVEAVISLPPGVFLPYTSVKGDILIFRKNGPTQKVWFFEVRNDGFELAASRSPIPGRNDIDVLYEQWNTKPETEQSWWADAASIAETDYDFSANRYMPRQAKIERYPLVRLGKLLRPKKKPVVVDDEEIYRRITVKSHGDGAELRDVVYGHQIRSKQQKVASAGQVIVSAIGAKSGAFSIIPQDLDGAIVSRDYYTYEIVFRDVLVEYIAFVLRHKSLEKEIQSYVRGSTGLARVRSEDFLKVRIPLPPIEKQREIVAKLQEARSAAEEAQEHLAKIRREIALDVFGTSDLE